MDTLTIQELIDSGVHFGCRVSRWNPKMAPYIHGRRNLIHVIDLRETVRGLIRAQNFLYHLVSQGSQILWVGTKRQVKGVIHDAGQRTGMPVVTERWIGGTLTNFSVIRSRLKRLEELESMEEDGSIHQFSKKVIASLNRERRKITRNLGGIREMSGIPGAAVVVDPGREYNAVREARKMGLVVIGVLDTDCDPHDVDIVIPGNDDSLKSVRLLIERLVGSVEEGAAVHREVLASTGDAERSMVLGDSDEPRPTRGNKPPVPLRSADGGAKDSGSDAAAKPAAEEASADSKDATDSKASDDAKPEEAAKDETAKPKEAAAGTPDTPAS